MEQPLILTDSSERHELRAQGALSHDNARLKQLVAALYRNFSAILYPLEGFASGTLHALLEQHIKEHDPNTRVVKLDLAQLHATSP